jgi:hypothetical protein
MSLVGRKVAIEDGTVLTSGTVGGNGAARLFISPDLAQPSPTWTAHGPTVQGNSASFGSALAIIPSNMGNCVPGQSQGGWKCRFVIGESALGKVHIYTLSSTKVWVPEQTLFGSGGFGTAISVTPHTMRELLLIGAPDANANGGLLHVYEWQEGAGAYAKRGEVGPTGKSSPFTSPITGGRFAFSIGQAVVDTATTLVVVGAPAAGHAFVYRVSTAVPTPTPTPVLFRLQGVLSGATRHSPSQDHSKGSKFGYAVAANKEFVYVGIPEFNKYGAYQHSVGAVQVGAFCPANHYVDVEASLSGVRLGASCVECPSPSHSQGGQTLACDGCRGIPGVLPQGAAITRGCTITCTGLYTYVTSSNRCVYRSHSTQAHVEDQNRADVMAVVMAIMVCSCLICFCCYIFKGPLHPQNFMQAMPMAAARHVLTCGFV